MCNDLLEPEHEGKQMLFWQTKSRVQPRGQEDEWARMQGMPPVVQTWVRHALRCASTATSPAPPRLTTATPRTLGTLYYSAGGHPCVTAHCNMYMYYPYVARRRLPVHAH